MGGEASDYELVGLLINDSASGDNELNIILSGKI
jgi:hypothetical protein